MFGEIAGLVKLAEDDLTRGRVYAYTRITDRDLHSAIRRFDRVMQCFGRDHDLAVVGRELDGVRQQVMEQFLEQVWVGLNLWQRWNIDVKGLPAFLERF